MVEAIEPLLCLTGDAGNIDAILLRWAESKARNRLLHHRSRPAKVAALMVAESHSQLNQGLQG